MFDIKQEYDKKRNELLLSDEIQKGKNAETRQAMIELELTGTNFDKLKEYELLLSIVRGVERHNDTVLAMFFV